MNSVTINQSIFSFREETFLESSRINSFRDSIVATDFAEVLPEIEFKSNAVKITVTHIYIDFLSPSVSLKNMTYNISKYKKISTVSMTCWKTIKFSSIP